MPNADDTSRVSYRRTAALLDRARRDRQALTALAGGGVVAELEAVFAAETDAPFALAVSSGTAALHAALLAADIGAGDEVIVSPYGWGQTVAAVLAVGATPVFVDVETEGFNLDPRAAATACGPSTRAVVVTHLFGRPAAMEALAMICKQRSLTLIADAAQAFGACLNGRGMGAWSDLTCFSLGRGKLISSGEGGVVTCRNPALFEKLILCCQHPLRAHAELEIPRFRQSIGEQGLSLRMAPLLAAVALDDLETYAEKLQARRSEAISIRDRIADISDLTLDTDPPGGVHAYHSTVARFDGSPEKFASILPDLEMRGLSAYRGPVHTPLHLRPPFSHGDCWFPYAMRPRMVHCSWQSGACPIAEQLCSHQEVVIEKLR